MSGRPNNNDAFVGLLEEYKKLNWIKRYFFPSSIRKILDGLKKDGSSEISTEIENHIWNAFSTVSRFKRWLYGSLTRFSKAHEAEQKSPARSTNQESYPSTLLRLGTKHRPASAIKCNQESPASNSSQRTLIQLPLAEPQSTRYLYVNSTTNKVHLLVPVIAGLEISSDNTCKSDLELNTFFESAAIEELEAYQSALAFDIALLEKVAASRKEKEERLVQIKQYLEAVNAMKPNYRNYIEAFLNKPSNLYSIQLRPRTQDPYSNVVNPVFSVNRKNDDQGLPLSVLYNKMHELYPGVRIGKKSPRQNLVEATLEALAKEAGDGKVFDIIKLNLKEQAQNLLGLKLDLTMRYEKDSDGKSVRIEADQSYIDRLLGIQNADAKEYIEALLNKFASNLETVVEISPFYLKQLENKEEKAEHLSILTQFYLGILNVYCKARGLSQKNFGEVLDNESGLSQVLVEGIVKALNNGDPVEEAICDIFSSNAIKFGLNHGLRPEDRKKILAKFDSCYKSATATKENRHMDDFMILDTDAEADMKKFVSNQGLICTDFANIVPPNQAYFDTIRNDKVDRIPSPRTSAVPVVEVEIETLLNNLGDIQWERLPQSVREACEAHPVFQSRQFPDDVAKGKQEEAKALLNAAQDKQVLLQQPSKFTDYSGRTFYCTAYEYAYWAKDTHMRRMLEKHMDEDTKAYLLKRIEKIEQIGLTYTQYGKVQKTSKNFDFKPLIKALEYYVKHFDNWLRSSNFHKIEVAWMAVGKAQRDVPAHVAQEYCRTDFSFEVRDKETSALFKEPSLPRGLTFFNSGIYIKTWFPLAPGTSGLGFDCAILKAGALSTPFTRGADELGCVNARKDLAAMCRLDEIRTTELTESRNNLNPAASSHSYSM